ncbi:MAG: DNA-binding response regulator [Deltaproteobacteria bacterium]|nr:DNA-binding response regulator [Deltaproteobacteria bacterium]
MSKRILIVDDEPSIRTVLRAHLKRAGYHPLLAQDGQAACDILSTDPVDLVVSDLKMPRMNGMELLSHCRSNHPGLPFILITAHGTVDSAVEAIKQGAHDYITKPFDSSELQAIIRKALATGDADRHIVQPDPTTPSALGRFGIIGCHADMVAVFDLIGRVAASPSTVLITGESGTGKELVARALHTESDRSEGPFIRVNCGAIPESLFESELFGHERGAFTGAVSARAGRFELADGGTLFLDEVGELPKDMQVKLLRVLQEQAFERVGGVTTHSVDVRVVAATNRDLRAAAERGEFREDLYYRLHVVPIQLPALRDRTDDIPLLVKHFTKRFNDRLGRSVEGVSAPALAALVSNRWSGNIRELENVMERAVLLARDSELGLADFPGLDAGQVGDTPNPEEMGLKEYVRIYTTQLERARIQRVLEQSAGNVTHASKRLGISRKSLQMKMKEYGLRDESR